MTSSASSALEASSRESAVKLIVQAFEAARQSSREDWSEMTIAVLKNRLLALTERTFDETAWGARSMREFVAKFPEVLSLDLSTHPPTARFLGDGSASLPQSGLASSTPAAGDEKFSPTRVDDPSLRVREDLWSAVLDHASGVTYCWDGKRAVEIPGDEPPPSDLAVLPQVTQQEIDDWRKRFVDQEIKRGCSDTTAQALQRWQQHRVGTRALSRDVRGRWNGVLKERVVDVLLRWFASRGLAPPDDITGARHAAEPEASETEQLRRFVVSCVMGMTRSELTSLSLPLSAVLRQRRGNA